jgi:hypothetical protein
MEPPAADLTEAPAQRFQAGGAVRESSLYVERSADAELREGIERGDLCAVIAPRQMGKSSLRRRAERRLSSRGVRCLAVDLGLIGCSGLTPEQWFYALGFHLAERSGAAVDLLRFWREHDGLPPAERWSRFLTDELFPRAAAPVAVFFDELDVALGLPFCPDAFFAAVREVNEARGRALSPALAPPAARVPVCLFGVTAPEGWVRDPSRSPFTVDRLIRLAEFTPEEAAAFLPGLRAAGGDAPPLLSAVLRWTAGHPYLTQRLCELLSQAGAGADGSPEARVTRLVSDGSLEETALTVSPA